MSEYRNADILRRALVNDTIAAFNRRDFEAARELILRAWHEEFRPSSLGLGDIDVLDTLVKLAAQLLPSDDAYRQAQERLFDLRRKHGLDQPLHVIYDLGRYGPQFDVVTLLVQAKTLADESRRPLNVVFLPTDDGVYVKPGKYSAAEAIFRLHHICVPACALYGASSTILGYRDSPMPNGDWLRGLPPTHDGVMKVFDQTGRLSRIRATAKALDLVRRFTGQFDKPVVSITLRNTFRNKGRNSRIEDWIEVANQISGEYQPVFVPDTEDAFHELGVPYPAFVIGAVDLDARLAFYELAAMNFFNHNGPAVLAQFGTAPFVNFGLGNATYMSAEDWEKLRLPVGLQPPYLRARQRLVWEEAEPDRIVAEFSAVMSDGG